MTCIFAVFEIYHRSHSPLCSLFQISKLTKIQVKIAQLILSPLLRHKKIFRGFCNVVTKSAEDCLCLNLIVDSGII